MTYQMYLYDSLANMYLYLCISTYNEIEVGLVVLQLLVLRFEAKKWMSIHSVFTEESI